MTALTAICDRGTVTKKISALPAHRTNCPNSFCRHWDTMRSYVAHDRVTVASQTDTPAREHRRRAFHRRTIYGKPTSWQAASVCWKTPVINMRAFDPAPPAGLPAGAPE